MIRGNGEEKLQIQNDLCAIIPIDNFYRFLVVILVSLWKFCLIPKAYFAINKIANFRLFVKDAFVTKVLLNLKFLGQNCC